MIGANKLGAFGLLVADGMRKAAGDVSPTAAAILLTLYYRGARTASELAEIAGIKQPTAVRVVGGLAGRGWVRRGERVGKTAPLRLTPSGRKKAKDLQTSRLATLHALLAHLTGKERDELQRLIDKILASATGSRRFERLTCRLCDHALCVGAACPIGTRAKELERSGPENRKG